MRQHKSVMSRHWISIALALTVVAGGFILLDSSPTVLPMHEPDSFGDSEFHLSGYLVGVTTTQYQEDGSVEYHFMAERLSRYQVDLNRSSEADYTLIRSPTFIVYQAESAPWHISAIEGESRQHDELFILQGDVLVWQDDAARGRTELTTQELHFRPQSQVAETDEFVMITQGRSRSQGYGMHGDLKQETLQILSEGKTVYEPNP